MTTAVDFKHRLVDSRGQVRGFLVSSRGRLGPGGLVLKDRTVPVSAFLSAVARDKRVVFAHQGLAGGEPTGVVVEVYGTNPRDLAKAYNRLASDVEISRRRSELESQGRGGTMRVEVCKSCGASINLTDFEPTPEVMCPFCDSVGSEAVPVKEQEQVRVCEKCGFYAFPRTITCFYFYFLLVVYGFRWQRKHMCGPCMRAEGWKMLAGNLIFLLGVPVAVTQLIRAYSGGAARSTAYKGLERGNIDAKHGRAEQAAQRYAAIADQLGGSAVAAYNKGLAYARVSQMEPATQAFEEALLHCSNFVPAAQALAGCYARQQISFDDHPLLAPFRRDRDAEVVQAGAHGA